MSTETDNMVAEAAKLREVASEFAASLQDANTRNAIIEDSLTRLANKLATVADGVNWDNIEDAINVAALKALESVEKLADALDEAGVEYA